MEFFSKFDWENFCVSLWGPVPISSLPDVTGSYILIKDPFVYIGLGLCCVLIVFRLLSLTLSTAEPPRKDGGDLLLSKLFLDACSSVYAVFPGGQENQGQPFVSKHFNVIDPLRVNNNLGRSVSKGLLVSKFGFGSFYMSVLLFFRL